MSTPARSVHTCNWSIAAARKVSAAATRTFLPSLLNWWHILPIVVVLPAPLTPMTIITAGDFVRSSPVSSPIISEMTSYMSSIICCGSVMPRSLTFLRTRSHISTDVSTPISLIIICSSSCSKSSSSIFVKELKTFCRPPMKLSLVFFSPCAILENIPILSSFHSAFTVRRRRPPGSPPVPFSGAWKCRPPAWLHRRGRLPPPWRFVCELRARTAWYR